jgi:hypothetical protein
MKILLILTCAIAFLVSGCGTTPGVPTAFADACNPDNEKKHLEVSGVIEQRGSVFCSNTSGRMECGFDLRESPGGEKKFSVDIEQGSGANTVDKLERGYKKEDVQIRDNAGNQIALGSDKVKVTGKMSVVPPMGNAQGVCFMQANKIER